MPDLELIDQSLLSAVSLQAATSPRLRKNYNFHRTEDELSHRLLNAIEPGSYLVPHRHMSKDETMIMLTGAMGLIIFDEQGNVKNTFLLAAHGDLKGVNIIRGTYHSLVSFETGTVFFESKLGPYEKLTSEEIASWAPAEGSTAAAEYYLQLRKLFSKGAGC